MDRRADTAVRIFGDDPGMLSLSLPETGRGMLEFNGGPDEPGMSGHSNRSRPSADALEHASSLTQAIASIACLVRKFPLHAIHLRIFFLQRP